MSSKLQNYSMLSVPTTPPAAGGPWHGTCAWDPAHLFICPTACTGEERVDRGRSHCVLWGRIQSQASIISALEKVLGKAVEGARAAGWLQMLIAEAGRECLLLQVEDIEGHCPTTCVTYSVGEKNRITFGIEQNKAQ